MDINLYQKKKKMYKILLYAKITVENAGKSKTAMQQQSK